MLGKRDDVETVADRLSSVRERIGRACFRADRSPSEVRLIAVTKQVGPASILEAYQVGQRDFGESYWQEARGKLDLLPSDVRWHFVGHLQANKARHVVERFGLIHSVDSMHLAEKVARQAQAIGRTAEALLEVNASGEQSKYGVPSDLAPEIAGAADSLPGLRIVGLMGMALFGRSDKETRQTFARLREIAEKFPPQCRRVLSMGMSGDFEAAVVEGATHVRIGTAIFGERPRGASSDRG